MRRPVFGAPRLSFLAIGLALLLLPGCGSFFNPSGTSSSGSGGSGSSGTGLDDVYVANSSLSLESIAAYSLSSTGTLSSLAGSPTSIGSAPFSMAINPAGTLLWVSTGTGAVYVYVIQSNGALALGNSNSVVQEFQATSMQVDPSGQWLVAMTDAGTAPEVTVYAIDQTNGTLTQTGQPIALDAGSGFQLKFAPNGTNVFAALGTGGVDSLLFTPSTGALAKLNVILNPSGANYADQALAVDPKSQYLYVAETGVSAVRAFTINAAAGTLTAISGSPFATGLGPSSLLVDSTGAYLYAANSTDGTISAFTIGSTGALTAIAGSPFATGSGPESLAEDETHSFLVAANVNGTPDLEVFSIASATSAAPGALASTAKASTGSVSPAGALAVVASP